MSPIATTCATCHRALWASDADSQGNCCFCQPPPRPVVADPTPKSTPTPEPEPEPEPTPPSREAPPS